MTPVQTAKRIGRGTLKPQNWIQLLQFGVVGVSGYIVNLAVFAVAVGPVNVHHILAAIIAFALLGKLADSILVGATKPLVRWQDTARGTL